MVLGRRCVAEHHLQQFGPRRVRLVWVAEAVCCGEVENALNARAELMGDRRPTFGLGLVGLLDQGQRRQNAGDVTMLDLAHVHGPNFGAARTGSTLSASAERPGRERAVSALGLEVGQVRGGGLREDRDVGSCSALTRWASLKGSMPFLHWAAASWALSALPLA